MADLHVQRTYDDPPTDSVEYLSADPPRYATDLTPEQRLHFMAALAARKIGE